jgi:hypothetical protein
MIAVEIYIQRVSQKKEDLEMGASFLIILILNLGSIILKVLATLLHQHYFPYKNFTWS